MEKYYPKVEHQAKETVNDILNILQDEGFIYSAEKLKAVADRIMSFEVEHLLIGEHLQDADDYIEEGTDSPAELVFNCPPICGRCCRLPKDCICEK